MRLECFLSSSALELSRQLLDSETLSREASLLQDKKQNVTNHCMGNTDSPKISNLKSTVLYIPKIEVYQNLSSITPFHQCKDKVNSS